MKSCWRRARYRDTQQNVRNGFEKTKGDYRQFIDTWKQYGNDARGIRGVPQLSDSFDNLRNGLLAVHRKALENISSAEINSVIVHYGSRVCWGWSGWRCYVSAL
ncbi:hypothetical protein GS393_00203 [Pseudomonas savastanoi pv. phaseolicola]|nr:hypothetical protein [Pseudomonas savastanoi pv. phaseolicola]